MENVVKRFDKNKKIPYLVKDKGLKIEELPRFADGGSVHTIKKGDWLSKIANSYGTSVDELVRINNIRDINKLEVGQRITIPRKTQNLQSQNSDRPSLESYMLKQTPTLYASGKFVRKNPTFNELPQDVEIAKRNYTKEGIPFSLLSKTTKKIYDFNNKGELVQHDEVGIGKDKGDLPNMFYERKTTPDGEYEVTRLKKEKGYLSENMFAITALDEEKRPVRNSKGRKGLPSMHAIPSHLVGERYKAMNDGNPDNNNLSAGCVNCNKKTLDSDYYNNLEDKHRLFVSNEPGSIPTKRKSRGILAGIFAQGGSLPQKDSLKSDDRSAFKRFFDKRTKPIRDLGRMYSETAKKGYETFDRNYPTISDKASAITAISSLFPHPIVKYGSIGANVMLDLLNLENDDNKAELAALYLNQIPKLAGKKVNLASHLLTGVTSLNSGILPKDSKLTNKKISKFADGGELPQYEVEGGEVVQGDAQLQSSKKIASDLHHVTGATHEEGGVVGQGGERVFSNRLNIPVELLAVLRKSKIKADPLSTYADVAANIGKMKGKFESKLGSYKPRTVNTGKLMLERVDGLLDMVFNTQEQSKLPVFAKGGKLPKYVDGAELQTSFDTPQMLKSRQANATLLENKKWMSDWYENRKMPNFGTQVVLNNSKDKLRHNLEEAVNIDVKDDPNYYGTYKPLGRQITVGSPNKSGVLHELTHAVDIGNGVPDMVTNPANYWNKIVYDKLLPTDKPLSSNDLYLRDPYEIHARIMQLRQKAGIKPDEYVTPERLDGFLKSWKKAPNDETFGRSLDELINTFRDNNKLIHALNFSTSNKGANTEYRLGGKLRKYEDGGDPGVPNVVDKSKVWLKDWYANREIPNPAGMAALQQSQNGLQRNLNTVTENNNGVFKSDKHLGYYDPMTHKVAFNENATLSPIDNAATKTHELTHASEYKRNTGTSSAVNWNKKVIESNLPPFAKGDSEYYRNPIEVHARIMELRRTAGFKPNQIVTEQELNDYMDRLDKLPYGKAPVLEIDVQKGLDGVFRDRKRLLNVINLTTDNKELGGNDYKLGGRIKMLPLPKYARGGALPPRNLSKLRRYSTSPFFNDKPVNEVITLSPYKNRFPNSDSPLTGLEPVVNNSNPNKLPQAEVTAARLPKKPLSINNVTGFQTQNLGDKIKPISAPQQEGVPETGDLEYKPDNANLLLTALGAVGNTLINSKYDTSVKRNLMQNPGYTYNDRSGLSQWQTQQAYRTGLKSLDLSTSQGTQNNAANMMWKTQNILSQIHNQENQRRDQYNSQYADSVWRTQAANTGIVNQANDMRRDLKNDKLAGYQNILNNTIGNVNTILSERDARRLETDKLNWIGKRGNLGGRNITDFQQEEIDRILGLTPKKKK